MNRKLLSILKNKRKMAYNNPNSILKKYDEYLESHGIYHSLNNGIFKNSIHGHIELCDKVLELYHEATLENERIVLLEDLLTIGYNKDRLVELILTVFDMETPPTNLWEYADLLFTIKNFRYMSNYINIIKNSALGENRQMLVLLVGKSKQTDVVPILTELLDDPTVYGHALDALSNFSGDNIAGIMHNYINCDIGWIREIAEKYLSKNNSKSN